MQVKAAHGTCVEALTRVMWSVFRECRCGPEFLTGLICSTFAAERKALRRRELVKEILSLTVRLWLPPQVLAVSQFTPVWVYLPNECSFCVALQLICSHGFTRGLLTHLFTVCAEKLNACPLSLRGFLFINRFFFQC